MILAIIITQFGALLSQWQQVLFEKMFIEMISILVGYGDFAPKTIPGRSIGFLACVSGSICVSLLVLTLENLLNLNSSETKVMSLIDRITIKKKRRKESAHVLLYFTKLFYIGKTQTNPDWKKVKSYVNAMKKHLQKMDELKK